MTRLARIVVPGLPHYVTQRGNRDMKVFFGAADYRAYRELLAEGCQRAKTQVLAYCLLPDRVHLLLVPSTPDGLRGALGEAHRRYTRRINGRESWHGHLWQERFHSFAMQPARVDLAARFVELAPLRAKLVRKLHRWTWSSAAAHLAGEDDGLVRVAALLKRFPDWAAFLGEGLSEEQVERIQRHERSGRPLGGTAFIKKLEERLGRTLTARPPGRPRKNPA